MVSRIAVALRVLIVYGIYKAVRDQRLPRPDPLQAMYLVPADNTVNSGARCNRGLYSSSRACPTISLSTSGGFQAVWGPPRRRLKQMANTTRYVSKPSTTSVSAHPPSARPLTLQLGTPICIAAQSRRGGWCNRNFFCLFSP